MTRPRIVIADDSRQMREIIEDLVDPNFDVVASVEDGRAAVDAAERYSPDLVLLDISMPTLNGIQAGQQINECCPSVLFLVVSEHSERSYVEAAFSAGARGFVPKRKIASELLTAMQDILAGKEYGRPLDGLPTNLSRR